jgi:hypothetical protein
MASQGDADEGTFTENFPAPPPFWKQFTDENVENVKLLKEKNEAIPEDLSVLAPPAVPEETFRSFGQNRDVRV